MMTPEDEVYFRAIPTERSPAELRHRAIEAQLAAATKRADDAERERDAALAVLRDIQKRRYPTGCPCCVAKHGNCAPSCALAACLSGGAE